VDLIATVLARILQIEDVPGQLTVRLHFSAGSGSHSRRSAGVASFWNLVTVVGSVHAVRAGKPAKQSADSRRAEAALCLGCGIDDLLDGFGGCLTLGTELG
jgi:hypothetical protein